MWGRSRVRWSECASRGGAHCRRAGGDGAHAICVGGRVPSVLITYNSGSLCRSMLDELIRSSPVSAAPPRTRALPQAERRVAPAACWLRLPLRASCDFGTQPNTQHQPSPTPSTVRGVTPRHARQAWRVRPGAACGAEPQCPVALAHVERATSVRRVVRAHLCLTLTAMSTCLTKL